MTGPINNQNPPVFNPTEPVKPKPKRCWTCKKKVGLLGFDCKCQRIFCAAHRLPEEHECTYDHKADAQEKLSKQLVKVVAPKVNKF